MLNKTKSDFFTKIALKDFKTIDAYEKRIKVWEQFCLKRLNKSDYIPTTREDAIDIFQLFVNWFSLEAVNHRTKKKGHSPNSVWNHASSIRKYLFYRGSPLTRDDVQEHIELPRKNKKELHGLTIEEIQRILNSLSYEDKTMFLCQSSALMRIGELVQLRKKHLVLDTERIKVKIPSSISKFGKARTTFFSKEAGSFLSVMLKRLNDNDLIFGTCDNVQSAESTKGETLRRHLISVGLDQKYEDTGNYQINTHSFRAYGITKVSRHDPNLAKFFAGEEGYLLQYDRLTDDEKLEEYLGFEKDLFIFDLVKKEEEIKKLRIANTKISDQDQKIQEQERRIKTLERVYLESKNII